MLWEDKIYQGLSTVKRRLRDYPLVVVVGAKFPFLNIQIQLLENLLIASSVCYIKLYQVLSKLTRNVKDVLHHHLSRILCESVINKLIQR